MSYYIGSTGTYIWEELIENTTSNVVIANNINFDATPLTDAIQDIITDTLGTAVGELIQPITEVPSATGVGVVALTALGLLSYYKLNRTAVQDVDSMVYSADYASILTPGMFDDRVRIRYDNEWFSNAIYYEGGVKKGEILTYRPEQGSNILNLDATNIKLGTINNARLPLNYGTELGIGTSPAVNTNLHIYNVDNPTIRLEAGANGTPGIEFQRGATNDVNVDFKIVNDTGRLKFLSQDEVDTYQTPASEIMRMTRTQLSIYENTEINGNLLLQSVAEGTPTVEFRRGTVSDANKDYRFISQSDIFKLQFQDTLTNYSDTNNQLISINDTDTIIYKQTEFKANVLIGGDTRTVGYVGIGTTAATPLHIYTAAANILRLQTAPVSGTNSIEFMRGNSTDPLTDYRILTDTGGKFKIQYANNLLAYGATDTDLIDLSTTNTIIYKPTEFKGNVGIGTAPHATYKVDVNGTVNATAFRGNGAEITDIGADKISTGSLNLDRITLTTSKLYQNFNQINFAIIDDKIDLPAEYSINITAYDNPTLHSDIRYKGKMSVSYDDRRNIYKLVTSDTSKTDNVAVLKYKAGDRIHIRNIANTEEDFITTTSGATIYLKTVLFKRAFSLTFNKVTDGLSNFTQVFEWESRGYAGVPQVVDYRIQDGSIFPRYNFTKLMTFVVEAGYAYYLMRLWRDPTNGIYNEVALADDFDDYLRAFGAGQTFRLESGYNQAGIDYIPRTYTPPGLSVGSSQELGGVKPRRGMAIDASTGYLDAIPLSSDLITNMNTSHFTNNTGTNKIDISSTYVAPSATKLATARNIAGTAFDGSANIDITYGNLSSIPATWGESQIPSLPISKITNLQSTLDGKAPTSHTHVIADITNLQSTLDGKAPTSHNHTIANITNLQTTLDGKAPTSHTHVIGDITNLQTTLDGKAPTSHTHAIADITNLQTTLDGKAPTSHTHSIANITNLQTTLDGKQATLTAGTNITITGTTISSSTFTPTSTNLISVFNATQFVNNVGTSKIDIDVNWKPTTCSIADAAMKLVSSRNIAGVGFDGQNSIGIPYFNLDFKPTAGTGITITTGSSSSSPVISATPTSANMIGIFNTSQFTNNTGTSKIDILSTWKPSGAVLADTATALATSRNIAGVAFNGTADIAIDYFALTNRPIILQPTTTNLQLVSGYTLSVPGNMAVGTTAIATNILQVGAGGRLRIANGATDYTLLGTLDTDGSTNTSIVISGNTRSNNAGNIQYIATASGGSHIFYTSSPITTRMTISSSGVNINNNLGVSGTVGIATAPHATYKLDVLGDINVSGAFRINGTALSTGSRWSVGAVSTNIYYDAGNVGIGASTTSDVDDNTAFALPTARLYVKSPNTTGGTCDVVFRGGNSGQGGGKVKLWLASDASHSSYIQNEHPNNGVTHLSFGTASGNVLPVERMKIWGNGAVGIQSRYVASPASGGYALANNSMAAGSLTIGNIEQNYGNSTNWSTNTAGLMMECLNNTEIVIHDAGNALHSFMYYNGGNFTIGRNMAYGTANVIVGGYLNVGNYIVCPSYIISRNSYDAILLADSAGMYMNFGDINTGNATYLQISASNGVTNINSGSSRNIVMRTGGSVWTYTPYSGSFNAAGSIYWSNPSDHRIKENIKKANLKICYDNVKNINLYRFKYIDGYKKATQYDKTQLGFIAQQVKQHYPKSIRREKMRFEDKREVPDLSVIDVAQVNYSLFGAVKQLMRVVEKQSKRIKKLEEMLGIVDDDEVEDDTDEPYTRINCEDEVDIDDIEPSEHVGV